MWINEFEISKVMYDKCLKGNDKKKYWKNITSSNFAYLLN